MTERCVDCHGAAATHELSPADAVEVKLQHWNAAGTGAVLVGGVQLPAVSVDATTNAVTVRYHVTVAGAPRNDFTLKATDMGGGHNEDAFWVYNAAQKAGIREKIPCGTTVSASCTNPAVNWTVAANGNGNYTATITGFTAPPAAGTAFMLNATPPNGPTATVVAYNGARTHDVVSDSACVNCHGKHVWRGKVHDVTNAQGVGPCTVCHNRVGATEKRLTGADSTANPPVAAVPGTDGTGLMGIVHGIHNSKNMPDGTYTWVWTNQTSITPFKKGFPGNMDNCQTCHETEAELAAVKSAPVSYALCISCHDDWDGFPATVVGGPGAFHRGFTATTACSDCHAPGGFARATIDLFHNGLITERAGLIWDGADQSVVLGKTIKMEITGVTIGDDVKVTWTAVDPTRANLAYDPCNQDYATGPVFFGAAGSGSSEGCTYSTQGCASNMSFLRAYAQGDDWVNDNYPGGTAPGQPRSTNLSTSNTSCAAGVATTTLAKQTVSATRGIISLQGKPQVKWTDGKIIWVRSVTPTREFMVADGSLPGTQRREVADMQKCIACHLGTVYQHGGSRVDSMELCVMCHNPSSNEQYTRRGWGITKANAYDGKDGETIDMRTMIHAIHSAGETQSPLMYYRTNGIYFFGAVDDTGRPIGIKNWPNEADCVKCFDAEDGNLTFCPVYGSINKGKVMTSVNGVCTEGAADSTNGIWIPHRIIQVHYPRAVNDCSACHKSATPAFADPKQAAAVTFAATTLDATTTPPFTGWNDLLDDVLISPNTAACTTCHRSNTQHAYDFSWAPSTFENGRQTLFDAAQ